jgi:predicted amidohydrolase YtcJ
MTMKTPIFIATVVSAFIAHAALAADADLVLHNGKVLTVDKAFSTKSAVAVKDGKIVAVGGDEVLKEYNAPQKIDLKGRVLMPGFIDTHVHIQTVSRRTVILEGAKSIKEIQDRIRAKAKELGPGEWLTGFGWDEALLAEKRNISRADLDAAAPNNPVVLTRAGGHSNASNSAAMKIGKVDRTTADPPGGLIEKDAKGEPSGIVREWNFYTSYIPDPTWEEVKPGYINSLRRLLSLGITSYHSASTSLDDEPVGKGGIAKPGSGLTIKRLQEIQRDTRNSVPRVTAYITYPGPERLAAYPYHSGHGDEWVRVGAIGENAVDGGFTGPTAWLLADYRGLPGFRGKGRYTDEELQAIVDDSAKHGWQMGLHAIGDAAIVQTINAYSKAINTIVGKDKDHRWFTDHFTIMPPEATMKTMAEDKIIAAAQPNFLWNLEGRYNDTLDEGRLVHNNPVKTPLKMGVKVVFGSDNLPIGPMVGLYAATTRKGPTGRPYGLDEEGVTRQEAVRMYTAEGAYLSWEENTKGSIENGKLADMIVLDRDLMTVPDEDIMKTQVDLTILGGKVVYDRAAAKPQ